MPRVPGSTKAPEKCVKTKGQEAGVQRELLFLENVHRVERGAACLLSIRRPSSRTGQHEQSV